MTILTSWLDFGAAKKAKKRQDQLGREASAKDAAEFDRRLAELQASFGRSDALDTQRFDQTRGLADETFAYQLDNGRQNFDEQTGIAAKAFDDQQGALGGLMTAQRKSRLQSAADTEAEEARQRAIQQQADGLAAALPGQIGFDAQEAEYGDALARRTAIARATMTGAPADVPAWATDPTLAGAYSGEARRGYGEALTDATAAAGLSARSDAFQGSERKMGAFAGDIDALTNKAAISRSALPWEQAVAQLDKSQAGDTYQVAERQISDGAARRGTISGDYRGQMGDARDRYQQGYGGALDEAFGKKLGAEGDYIGKYVNTSQNYASKILGLANMKIAGTTAYSPLSAAIKAADSAVTSAANLKSAYTTLRGK